MRYTLLAATFAACVLCPFAALGQHDTRDPYVQALDAYEAGHYQDAISWLCIAGENNDVRAQQMLGLMYVYGEALYGPGVPRDLGLGKAWLYRAQAQGSPVARFALERLDQGRPLPPALAVANSEASGE